MSTQAPQEPAPPDWRAGLERDELASEALRKLVPYAPKPDPDLTVLDRSVSVSTWKAMDASVTQLVETDDGVLYAIVNHSRGYTGDDRFTLDVVTSSGLREVPTPRELRTIDFITFPGTGPLLEVYELGDHHNDLATFSQTGIRLVGAEPTTRLDERRLPRSERRCPSSIAELRTRFAEVTHGISLNLNTFASCYLVGDMTFFRLSAPNAALLFVAGMHAPQPVSAQTFATSARDVVLFQTMATVDEGEGSGFLSTFVLVRGRH